MLVLPQEFYLVVSMTDLVLWHGNHPSDCTHHPILKNLLNELGIAADLRGMHFHYFETMDIGQGDVYLHLSSSNPENRFVIDLYRGLIDTFDVITFGITCSAEQVASVRNQLRQFFDQASCQVHYQEASHSPALHELLDVASYPQQIPESGFMQNLHLVYPGAHLFDTQQEK